MARNGSGTYARVVSDYQPNADILSADMNSEMDDLGSEITNSIAKDGQTTPTANLPMGNFRHTSVGAASARTDYARASQVQDGAFDWGGTAGGTADARTVSLTPAITAYAGGMRVRFINGSAANTGACTLAVNGLTAVAIRKGAAATALAAGDLPADALVEVVHDGTVFRLLSVQPLGVGVSLVRAADAAAVRTAAGATSTGSDLLTAADAAATRTTTGTPAVPTTSSGVGEWVVLTSSGGGAATLPSGGTWGYVMLPVTSADRTWGTHLATLQVSVAAGGSTAGPATAGVTWFGFCWRIT